MSSIFGLLVLVLVLGAAVRGFRLIGGGRRDDPADTAGVRSLFAYVLTFVALIVAAVGIAGVLGALVDPPATARRSRFSAGELASAVVGVPVFLALAKSTIKRLVADEREAAGRGWSLYINVTLLTGLVTTLVFVFIVADDLLRGDVDRPDIASLVVWGAVWGAHWWAWDRFGDARRPDLYWFVSSIVGLAMFVGGFVVVLATLIERIIDAVEPAIVAAGRSGNFDMAVVTLVVGGVVWAWHWLRTGLPDESSSAWLLYVVLVGILGGVTMIYAGAVGALIRVTVWFVGRPDTSSGAEYFRDSSALLPIAIAGVGVWWYHRAVLGPRRTAERSEVDRLYDYLVVGAAALVSTGALTTLLVVVFSLTSPATAAGPGGDAGNTVIAAIALLVTGGPIWYAKWRTLQRRVAADQPEAHSLVRRVYLFIMLGIAGSVLFGSSIASLTVIFGALTGEQSGSVMADLRVPLALVIGSGVLGGYHLRLYLDERSALPAIRRRELIIVCRSDAELDELASAPGVSIRRMVAANGEIGAADAATILGAVEDVEATRILVIPRDDRVELIPLV